MINKNETGEFEVKVYLSHVELNDICEGLATLLKKKFNPNHKSSIEEFERRQKTYEEMFGLWESTGRDDRRPVLRGFIKSDTVITDTEKRNRQLKNRRDRPKRITIS